MNRLIIPIVVIVVIAAGIGAYFIFQKPILPEKSTFPELELQLTISEEKISPQGGRYGRVEVIEINNKLFMAFNDANTKTFKLVELNEDLSYKGQVIDIFSDSPRESIDIRLASDGKNLWYAFESMLPNRQESKSCNNKFLNMAKYSISGTKPELIASRIHIITNGCPSDPRKLAEIPPSEIPINPEATDDPTPIFYNGKYIVLTRAVKGSVQHIRTFDKDFNTIEDFTLDLKSVIGNRELSQNALVDAEGQIYLIGGLGSGAPVNPDAYSDIYAIPLSNDLRSVAGDIIPLVTGPDRYYTKTTSAIYDNGKLYINYVKAGDGQLQHLGVFDVKNSFASLTQIQVQEKSVDINHASFEVLGNRVYVFYPGESDDKIPIILGKVFEWKEVR